MLPNDLKTSLVGCLKELHLPHGTGLLRTRGGSGPPGILDLRTLPCAEVMERSERHAGRIGSSGC